MNRATKTWGSQLAVHTRASCNLLGIAARMHGKRNSVTRQAGQQAVNSDFCTSCTALVEAVKEQTRAVNRQTRLIRSYLLGRAPGRPRHRRVSLATTMRAQGRSWNEIYRKCLPDSTLYESREAYRQARENLKKAVRQRQKREHPADQPKNSCTTLKTAIQ